MIRKIIGILVFLGKPGYRVLAEIVRLTRQIKLRVRLAWGWFLMSMIMFFLSMAMVWVYESILVDLPNVNNIYKPPQLTTKILDRKGRVLYKFYRDENRSWVSFDQIPKSLIDATIAIEDKEFFYHKGISLRGVVKALWYNLFKKDEQDKLRGGSTLTQQMVKNVFFGNEKSVERKLKEAVLAILVEQRMSKEEILERYFNQVAYGGEIYGVQEAALKYFGKNVWEINSGQAAYLAGLPAAPSSYSPIAGNGEYALSRQRHVIDEMVKAGFFSQQAAEEVKKEEINLVDFERKIEAPHFVFFVREWLLDKYGFDDLATRGLTVKTSLDLEVQRMAEMVVEEEAKRVARLGISNGAALVVDIRNGDILAMVGSKDYWAKDIDGKYNVVTALRQPGSSIKPINYLLALKKGANLLTSIDDTPVTYPAGAGQKPYNPQNYNGKYMGKVSLTTALANSLNVPSVKFLDKNGVDNMIDLAEDMGITTWKDRSRFGLALALGGGEVKMTEMAQAYSIFANLGKKVDIDPILEIDNYLGENIFSKEVKKSEVVEAKYAFLINRVLWDDSARSAIFGLNSRLKIPGKTVAVKTGTTNNLRDNWCIGWTPTYLVAAWVGNNNNSPMSWVASGISGATPIWNRIMSQMLLDKPDQMWEVPDGVYKAVVCNKEEYFTDGREKEVECPSRLESVASKENRPGAE